MKIKSKEAFFDTIQKERSWRRKELTNLKSLIHESRKVHDQTLVRASILLLYSHWEGYIKKICESFFYYLNFKAHKLSSLKPNFLALSVANNFNGNFPQKKFSSYLKVVDFIINNSDELKFNIDVAARVDTKSNLNIDVLTELLDMLGLGSTHFKNNQYHIDNRLLKYRNAIAHGERTDNNPDLFVDASDFTELYERISQLMDYFESIVSNHVELETYTVCSTK